jgi:hypothetical protein
LVFPRNQFSAEYLGICREAGIEAVRGNQQFWLFRSKGEADETLIKKIGRRLDHYLPLSGYNGVTPESDALGIVNIRSSRFLLPVPIRSRLFGPLCQHRIAAAMTNAATTGRIFHLWWHPHNFGSHVADNMAMLRQILEHYRALAGQHGMVSRTMGEIAGTVRRDVSQSLQGVRPAQPGGRLDAMNVARVSVTAT